MKTENTTINKETAEQNNGLHPIEDTLEGLGVEKKERRRFLKALKNVVSQEVRDALKAMWEDINKRFEQVNRRFEQVNHRFEMMDMRFKEIMERLDRNENRMEKRIDSFQNLIQELLQAEREANEKRHRTTIWVFGICMGVITLVVGFLSTLIALNITGVLN